MPGIRSNYDVMIGGGNVMPKWRPFTWVIVVINVLFLIWIIAGSVA